MTRLRSCTSAKTRLSLQASRMSWRTEATRRRYLSSVPCLKSWKPSPLASRGTWGQWSSNPISAGRCSKPSPSSQTRTSPSASKSWMWKRMNSSQPSRSSMIKHTRLGSMSPLRSRYVLRRPWRIFMGARSRLMDSVVSILAEFKMHLSKIFTLSTSAHIITGSAIWKRT